MEPKDNNAVIHVLEEEDRSSTGAADEHELEDGGKRDAECGLEVAGEVVTQIRFLDLFRYADGLDWFCMAVGLFCSLVAGACLPAMTVIFGELIDVFTRWQMAPYLPPSMRVKPEELVAGVEKNTLFMLILGIGTFIVTYIYMGCYVFTGERISHRIRSEYLKAVLRQNIAWFDSEGAGEVATRITNDTLLIQDGISDKIPLAFYHLATFLSAFIIAFVRSWRLTVVLMCIFPFIVIIAGTMQAFNTRFQSRILGYYSVAGTLAEESIAAVRTVVAFNAQKKMSDRYNERLLDAKKEGMKKSLSTGIFLGMLFAIVYCGYALAFYYGARLINWELASPGGVTNVFFAILIGAFSLGQVAPELQAFAFARSAGAKMYYTIDRVPPIDSYSSSGDSIPEKEFMGRIEFKHVSFSYPSRPHVPVLTDFNLKVEPGTTVALVGASGSGKSTIIQLLERFYDPTTLSSTPTSPFALAIDDTSKSEKESENQHGIFIDGRQITSLNLRWLRQQFGLVAQEPVLFEGTVAENVAQGLVSSTHHPIALGSTTSVSQQQLIPKGVHMDLIINACKLANAHDFIMKLPQGYDTPVGERGLLLSGGQKQRIAIARAIIKDPKILLLDEATSALDTHSERVVQEALDRASKGRTTIVIAHRLSTIKNADKIVVMSRGEILEEGTHEGLLEREEGAYRKLCEAQRLAQEEHEDEEEDEEMGDEETGQEDTIDASSSTPDSMSPVGEVTHHHHHLDAPLSKPKSLSIVSVKSNKADLEDDDPTAPITIVVDTPSDPENLKPPDHVHPTITTHPPPAPSSPGKRKSGLEIMVAMRKM
ncbi:GTPase-activating protein, partial [Quaeritorhiza haematococci]